jgi:lipopolysaccharide biosynthesis glycosyltransferase
MREKTLPSSLEQQGYPANHAIAFCTDANYWPHVATAIKSLFVQSHFPLPDIYVFYEREEPQWMRKLNRLAKAHKQTIHFRRFGLELLKNIEINNRFGPAAYFRIYLPDLLDKYRYILYLDSDLIATSDVCSIFSQVLSGSLCIAARCALKVELNHHNARLDRPLDTPYFNSGVLLIDSVRWREERCTEEIISILKDSPELSIYAEQDALNLLFQGHFHELPYQYNVTRRFYEEQNDYSYPGEEILIREAAKAPILVHFSGPSKPWHLHNKHPFRHRYRSLRGSFHWYPYSLGHLEK